MTTTSNQPDQTSRQPIDRPITVGPRTLRGRVYLPAHQPGLAENGLVSDRYIAYHRARARAGVAMQITGAQPVTPSAEWGPICLWNLDESCVPGYQRLAEAVHAEGGTMLAQLAHPGPTEFAGAEVIGASRDFSEVSGQVVMPADSTQLDHVLNRYAEAVDRCRRGDLDGVEISMAHGLLLASFLSPLTNHRQDEFGGSLANRLRFPLAVLQAARQALGPDRILGVRLGVDDLTAGGLTPETSIEIAQALAEHCDYLSVMVGNNNRLEARVRHWPPTPAPPGLFRHTARAVRQAVSVPVCVVGRVLDVELANDLIESGDADLVGIVRGHIADPELLPKTRDGRADEVRPCVGANVCVNGLLAGEPLSCLVNPDVGHVEESNADPQPGAGRAVVVGAGPAGLEAARRLAETGWQVTVLEQQPVCGGQLAAWSLAPSRREFTRWLDWAVAGLDRLGVQRRHDVVADVELVSSLQPELVVIATGASATTWPLGIDDGSVPVVDVITALTTPLEGRSVLVHDHCGLLDAAFVAEHLAAAGHQVTLATTRLHVGEHEGITTLYPMLRTLAEAGVQTVAQQRLVGVRDGSVLLAGTFGAPQSARPADVVVSWAGGAARTELAEQLRAAGLRVQVIGDARRPRRVTDALADARELIAGLVR